jgi:cytochrome P450
VLADRRAAPDDVEQLRYTGHIVDEALRLYPPGHTVVRTAVEDVRLLDHDVSHGRIVALSFWGIHHNPSVWPDPERSSPTARRVGIRRGRHTEPPPRSHLPFGGGLRACIGVHLALAELVIAVAEVLRAYRLRAIVAEPRLDAGLTRRPLRALRCGWSRSRQLRRAASAGLMPS